MLHKTIEFGGPFSENIRTSGQNLKGVPPTHSEDLWVQQDNCFKQGRSSTFSHEFSQGRGRNDESW